MTPLGIAIHYGSDDVAKLLIANGADKSVQTTNKFTPLHIAAKRNRLHIANCLLKSGAQPNAVAHSSQLLEHIHLN